MKLTLSSADLLEAASIPARATASANVSPIMSCLLAKREDDNRLGLYATDGEIVASSQVPAEFAAPEGEELPAAALPWKRLEETLKALPDLPVTLTARSGSAGPKVLLETDQGSYKQAARLAEDFPELPAVEEAETFELEGDTLARLIKSVAWATSDDALRPAMTGVCFDLPVQRLVATDGHRLASLRSEAIPEGLERGAIVPSAAASLIARSAKGDEGLVRVHVGASRLTAVGSDWSVSTVLVDETYLDYQSIIPNDDVLGRRLEVNAELMTATARRVGLYAGSQFKKAKFTLDGEVEVSTDDFEAGAEARETLHAKYDGPEMRIGFNHEYLKEAFGYVEGEAVMQMKDANRAAVLRPAEQREGEDLLLLVMPVMLNDFE